MTDIVQKTTRESRWVDVDLMDDLDDDELITGTPSVTVVETTSPALVFSPAVVNTTVAVRRAGYSVPIGQAVQFQASGGIDGQDYTIRILAGTSKSNTAEAVVYLRVKDTPD